MDFWVSSQPEIFSPTRNVSAGEASRYPEGAEEPILTIQKSYRCPWQVRWLNFVPARTKRPNRVRILGGPSGNALRI
jgi:hypothetical protein